MTVYALPAWFKPSRFELRLLPNLRTWVGPYTPTVQTVDLLGERWASKLELPPEVDAVIGAAREAYWDRLKGTMHQIAMPHMRLLVPQGTMRGTPTLAAGVAQLANTATLAGCGAGATLRAGDMLGIGGQLVRVMADAVANGSGQMDIEFQPRARTAWASGSAVTWNAPTANFALKSADGVPTVWAPGMVDGISIELIEVW